MRKILKVNDDAPELTAEMVNSSRPLNELIAKRAPTPSKLSNAASAIKIARPGSRARSPHVT